uniref:Uncharacterized protein n=1 Tax=Globodera rostochiensis TaxID=31243 RepID=A0A914H9L7_GLORO
MTRHAKNATAATVYTYHERRRPATERFTNDLESWLRSRTATNVRSPHNELTNTSRCVYLKTSNCVVSSWQCMAVAEPDIIELKRGGTGYAATNKLDAKL